MALPKRIIKETERLMAEPYATLFLAALATCLYLDGNLYIC